MSAAVVLNREIDRLEDHVLEAQEERVRLLRRVEELDSYLSLMGEELRELREALLAVPS